MASSFWKLNGTIVHVVLNVKNRMPAHELTYRLLVVLYLLECDRGLLLLYQI
jgi:hypothetical protein